MLAAAAASDRGGVRAVEHDGRETFRSYRAVLQEALAIAGALQASGLRAGDRVALVVPEVADFIRAFFGISAAGLVPVPLCPPAQAGDLPTFTRQSRHILAAGRANAVVTSADVAPLIDAGGLEPEPPILTIDRLQGARSLTAPMDAAADSPALLQFTSGSTAAPKGVVLTHANLQANLEAMTGPCGLAVTSADSAVSWLPLYHDMGLIGMLLSAVCTRDDITVLSPVLFLKRPTAWLEAISTHRATVSFAPTFAYELCVRRVKPSQIEALDLSSWRVAGCGAEPIRPETLDAFADRFAPAGFRASSFLPSYGLAEHSLAVTFAHGGLRLDAVDADALVRTGRAAPGANGSTRVVRLAACGRPFPDHEVRIVGGDGLPLRERHVGAIVARGPSVMRGYFDDPAATSEVLRDGWLHTGDLGYLAGGELFVCGRTKDLIVRQGRKHHPPDLEAALADVPGIRASGVAVVGIGRVGEDDEVAAVIEARASAAPDDLVDRARRRVRETSGLDLDRVIVAPPGTIPRTTSGKVKRAEIRERIKAGTLLER